ncbi:hypothetical protein KKB99_01200, partial [bacterium]|nr:hypothetical protein [bacterium]MBU1024603.1 hypothetical protein [bacterium]
MKKIYTIIAVLTLFLIAGLAIDNYSNAATTAEKSENDRQKKVNRSIENIDNGVVIELTSTDPEIVKRIQERAGKASMEKQGNKKGKGDCGDVVRTVTNIENGVRITMTSDNPETVKKIQERARKGHKGGK